MHVAWQQARKSATHSSPFLQNCIIPQLHPLHAVDPPSNLPGVVSPGANALARLLACQIGSWVYFCLHKQGIFLSWNDEEEFFVEIHIISTIKIGWCGLNKFSCFVRKFSPLVSASKHSDPWTMLRTRVLWDLVWSVHEYIWNGFDLKQ